eukprot:3370075-Rhodomonas_salina.1
MQPKLSGSSAAGKQPKDALPQLAFKYGEQARSALLDAKISTQKVWVRFAKHKTVCCCAASIFLMLACFFYSQNCDSPNGMENSLSHTHTQTFHLTR